jgi:hypothetical protein
MTVPRLRSRLLGHGSAQAESHDRRDRWNGSPSWPRRRFPRPTRGTSSCAAGPPDGRSGRGASRTAATSHAASMRELVRAGESVVRVSPKFMAGPGAPAASPGKSDPIDALAVARAVLREPDLPVATLDGPIASSACSSTIARTSSANGPATSSACAGSSSNWPSPNPRPARSADRRPGCPPDGPRRTERARRPLRPGPARADRRAEPGHPVPGARARGPCSRPRSDAPGHARLRHPDRRQDRR